MPDAAPKQIPVTLPPTAAQVEAIKAAGPGAVVQHPRAKTKAGRREIAGALGRAGLPAAIVRTLGWSSIVGESTGKVKPKVVEKAAGPVKAEAPAPKPRQPKPEPVRATE